MLPHIKILRLGSFSPSAPVADGARVLTTNWDERLWSALTVGHPSRHYVFKVGRASMYEAIFRTSLVRMAVELSGPGAWRLRRTTAEKTLDPSEKGVINYSSALPFPNCSHPNFSRLPASRPCRTYCE